jgi:predicted metal-dependent enzyme (double-stranded beta helix superfamily)
MLDRDELIARCLTASQEGEPRLAVKEVLAGAISGRGSVASVDKPESGWLDFWYRSPRLTVLNAVWPPHVTLYPHDHRMWAVIGIYGGQEDNAFFRRQGNTIVESGGKQLRTFDVLILGDDAIHSVHNPLAQCTGAIHVYGGDFVTRERSQWDPVSLVEEPYDLDKVRTVFEEAEQALERSRAAEPSDG